MTLTPTLVLLLIIGMLLVAAVTQWTRYLRGLRELNEKADAMQRSVAGLVDALVEDATGDDLGEDVMWALKEEKAFAAHERTTLRASVDEIRAELGMPPMVWVDRETVRRQIAADSIDDEP